MNCSPHPHRAAAPSIRKLLFKHIVQLPTWGVPGRARWQKETAVANDAHGTTRYDDNPHFAPDLRVQLLYTFTSVKYTTAHICFSPAAGPS